MGLVLCLPVWRAEWDCALRGPAPWEFRLDCSSCQDTNGSFHPSVKAHSFVFPKSRSWCNCSFSMLPKMGFFILCILGTHAGIQKQARGLSMVLHPNQCVLLLSFAVWLQTYVHTATLVPALELTPPAAAQGFTDHTLLVSADETCGMDSLIYWPESVGG